MPLGTYDLTRVQLSLGGQRIEGFGADAAVEFERTSELGEIQTSADGAHTFSRSNDHGMIATITCGETKAGYKALAERMKTQQDQAPIERLAFQMYDPLNGDRVSDGEAVFLEGPVPNKGQQAGERTFRIFLPSAGKNAKLGTGIA